MKKNITYDKQRRRTFKEFSPVWQFLVQNDKTHKNLGLGQSHFIQKTNQRVTEGERVAQCYSITNKNIAEKTSYDYGHNQIKVNI